MAARPAAPRPRRRRRPARRSRTRTPMLKTSYSSAGATRPRSAISSKTGGTGSGESIRVADLGLEPQQVEEPVAGDVGETAHVDVRLEQRPHGAHVDHGRLEQQVATVVRRPARSRSVSTRGRGSARSSACRSRDADDRVAGLDPRAGHDRVEVDEPDAEADQVEAARRGVAPDQVGQDGQLAAGDLDAGPAPRRACRPTAICSSTRGVGVLDGDVVEQRDRVGARRRSTSLTFIAMQSMPTVSKRPSCSATITLEPTPSRRSASPRRSSRRSTLA